MRVPYLSLLALFGVYILVTAPFHDGRVPAFARGVATVASSLPDPKLTPGAVLTSDAAKICLPGFARSVRHTAYAVKRAIYAEYHVTPRTGSYEIDHLIPIALGGADVAANLWPLRHDLSGSARDKDRLEIFLQREVCAGRVPLHEAQRDIAKDWHAAYRKYLGAE